MNNLLPDYLPTSKRKLGLLVLSALLLYLAIGVFTESNSNETESKQTEDSTQHLPAISVIQARQAFIADTVLLSGLVEPEEQVFVHPQIEGQPIDTLHANVGDYVEADQVLATLSTTDLLIQKNQLLAASKSALATIAQTNAQITDAAAAAEESERVRKRTAILSERGVVSKAEIDAATAAAQSAKARLNAAEQAKLAAQAQRDSVVAQIEDVDYRLARAEVKAPVSGLIESRNARLGAIATANTNPMFVIIRDNALELRADASESNLTKLEKGQRAQISISGSTKSFKGHIDIIEPSINRTTRLGRVRISIDDDSSLISGMFAEARIEVKSGDSIVLPASAIEVNEQGSFALLVEDDYIKRIPIITGARDGQNVEVIDGLALDDVVVARAGAFVRDGDRIRPKLITDSTTTTDE